MAENNSKVKELILRYGVSAVEARNAISNSTEGIVSPEEILEAQGFSSQEAQEQQQGVQLVKDMFVGVRQQAADSYKASANRSAPGQPFFTQLQNLISTKADANPSGTTIETSEGTTILGATRYPKIAYEDRTSTGARRTSPSVTPEEDVALPGNRIVRYADDDPEEPREENDSPVFIMDALVYIQGVEISEFIQGQVRVTLNGTEGFNEASFTVDNAHDRFVWTERNLFAFHGASAARANAPYIQELRDKFKDDPALENILSGDSELFQYIPEFQQELRRIAFSQQEQLKREIYDYKTGIGPDGKPRNPPIRNPKNTLGFARFDLVPGRCIINRMDPVRIFSLYPFRVPGREWEDGSREELWMPEFTGYVNNVSIDDDEIRGASRITIDCVDFRQAILRRMRLSADLTSGLANPLDALGFQMSPTAQRGASVGQTNQQQGTQRQIEQNTEGFYNIDNTLFFDDIINTNFNQPFPNKPLEEAVRDVLVANEPITEEKNNRGVRGVEFGGNFYYDSLNFTRNQAQEFLEQWHKFCLFGPKRRPWTRREVELVGRGTTTDGTYAPNKVRLWFLLPIEGSGPRNLADLSQISVNLSHDVNWTNRQEVITNFASSLDYNFMVTPYGDLICEFTFADFRPEDFGEFKRVFRVDKGLIASQFGSEQESPPAGLIVTIGFAAGATLDHPVAEAQLTKIFVYSPYIAARYGIEIENESIPFLVAGQKEIAQQRAVMLYQRRLARAHAFNMQFSYRPFIFPNRPLHHLRRTRMGLTVSCEKTISLGQQPKGEIQCGLEHTRLFTGHYRSAKDLSALQEVQKKDIKSKGIDPNDVAKLQGIDPTSSNDPTELQVYSTVAAGESTPTSNRVGWSNESILAPASGIYVVDLNKVRNRRYNTPSQNTQHEEAAEEVGDFNPPQEETPQAQDGPFKFPSNPLATMTVASRFGQRSSGQHLGIDLVATVGTPIYAVDDGVLRARDRQRFNGQRRVPGALGGDKEGHFLILRTDSGFEVWHMHLDPSTLNLINPETGQPFKENDRVRRGQQIAVSGNTGGVRPKPTPQDPNRGQHLHLELVPQQAAIKAGRVREDTPVTNQRIDPWPYFPASGNSDGQNS